VLEKNEVILSINDGDCDMVDVVANGCVALGNPPDVIVVTDAILFESTAIGTEGFVFLLITSTLGGRDLRYIIYKVATIAYIIITFAYNGNSGSIICADIYSYTF